MANEATHDFLVNRLQALPQSSALFLTDATGIQVNSSNFWPVPAVNLAGANFFTDAENTADSTAVVISAPSKSWMTGAGRCSSRAASKAAPASFSAPRRR